MIAKEVNTNTLNIAANIKKMKGYMKSLNKKEELIMAEAPAKLCPMTVPVDNKILSGWYAMLDAIPLMLLPTF